MTKLKNKAQLQQISDVAWLVRQGPRKLGILNKDIQEHYFYITGKEFVALNDEQEVTDYFGNVNLFSEQIGMPENFIEEFYIKGHKVDYPNPHPIDFGHPDYNPDVPLFSKTSDSDIYYAAGWYCIKFDKGWKHANGPKYSTIVNYGFEGPYKTEIECRQALKLLNKELRKQSDQV